MKSKGLGALVVSLLVLLGVMHPVRAAAEFGCCERKYLTMTRNDTERFPELLNVPGPVKMVSWLEIVGTGSRRSLSGSLVLREETLNQIQEILPDSLRPVARHEYVLPRPTKWYSLHFHQSDVADTTIRSIRRVFDTFREHEDGVSSPRKSSWSRLKQKFSRQGKKIGAYFIVTDQTQSGKAVGSPASKSKDYAIFQPAKTQWIVTGDIVVNAHQIGPMIRYLYRHDFHFLSLAHNSSDKGENNFPFYFVHFAGSGPLNGITPVVRTLLESNYDQF